MVDIDSSRARFCPCIAFCELRSAEFGAPSDIADVRDRSPGRRREADGREAAAARPVDQAIGTAVISSSWRPVT